MTKTDLIDFITERLEEITAAIDEFEDDNSFAATLAKVEHILDSIHSDTEDD